jgi:PAS domain S-box-containing protein
MSSTNHSIQIYEKLYNISKSFNEKLSLEELYDIAVDFVTDDLQFQKALIFAHDDRNGWFKVVCSKGYDNPMEQKILKIINLLLSGEVIEYLRAQNEPIIHTLDSPNEIVEKLSKSLFLQEAYFELFGGDTDIPNALIVVGNGAKDIDNYSRIDQDRTVQLALGNFTVQFSKAINNIIFYKAWIEEKESLNNKIEQRTKEILEQKDTFEAIFNTSKDGIAVFDVDTTAFLDANPAYTEMTGYLLDELKRTTCIKMSAEDDREKSTKIVDEVKKKGFVKNFEKRCRRKDGEIIIVSMSISLMSDKKRVLVSAKDITQQKILEAKIIEEKNKAQNATKAKSAFLANMSHEIRTPINGIIGMSHIALQSNLNPKQKTHVTKINKSAKLLLGIINDILDFSKVEAGKLSIEKIEFDLFDTLNSVIDFLELKIAEKGLEFELNYAKELGYMFFGDSLRISQILTNLLGNAVKFTEHGKIELIISNIAKNRYRFEVKDSGIGLTQEQQDKLFKSFSQADESTTRKYGGTGLGLSICKQLVELMNGKIWVESKLGIGSSFIFEIELEKLDAPSFSNIDSKIEKDLYTKSLQVALSEDYNILLVEDTVINQDIIIGLLENSQINIDIANNGQEAVELFDKNIGKYNLILMDIQMPIMDGYEATKIIREKDKQIPIVALTANLMAQDKENIKNAQMNEFISKPFDIEIFYETLNHYISISQKQNNNDNFKYFNFEHIDSSKAIKKLLDVNLYSKILKDFYKEFKDFELDIQNEEKLKRDIHTIKGLSGTICANSLYEITQILDNKIDLSLFGAFHSRLKDVMDDIASSIDIEEDHLEEKTVIDDNTKSILFEELKTAIASKRPANIKHVVEEIEKYKLLDDEQKLFDELKSFLKKYDFNNAYKLITNKL